MRIAHFFEKAILFTFLLLPLGVSGQVFPQYWVFEKHGGFKFYQDSTVKFSSSCDLYPGSSYPAENVATITLDSIRYFYADGDNIFNWKGDILLNGSNSNLQSLPSFSETNGTLLLPSPINNNKFFWISVNTAWSPLAGSVNYGLKYSIVDADGNSGNGEVIQDFKEVYLVRKELTERLMSVKNEDGVNWWIIAQEYPSGKFLIYKTNGDIIEPHMEYSFSQIQLNHFFQTHGEWDFDASLGVLSYVDMRKSIVSLRFDRCQGRMEYISTRSFSGDYSSFYGFTYSPDSRCCYVTCQDTNNSSYKLVQFEVDAPGHFSQRRTILVSDTTSTLWPLLVPLQLQKAPDGTVLFTVTHPLFPLPDSVNYGFIGRIERPGEPFPACQISWNYFSDTTWPIHIGLPNLPVDVPWGGITPSMVSTSQDTGCYPLTVSFDHNSCGQLGQVWDFGDGSAVDSSEAPLHTYTQPGDYIVTLTLWHHDTSVVLTYPTMIHADDCVQASFQADTLSGCYDLEVIFTPQVSGNVEWLVWDFGHGTVSDTIREDSAFMHHYTRPGNYTVVLTVGNGFSKDRQEQTGLITVTDCGDYFEVYPNPSGGHVTVEYHQDAAPFKGVLWDTWGRKLTELNFEPGYHKLPLDLSTLASAMYVLRVELPNGEMKIVKLIVEK